MIARQQGMLVQASAIVKFNVSRSPLPAANYGVRFRFWFPLFFYRTHNFLFNKREIEIRKKTVNYLLSRPKRW